MITVFVDVGLMRLTLIITELINSLINFVLVNKFSYFVLVYGLTLLMLMLIEMD